MKLTPPCSISLEPRGEKRPSAGQAPPSCRAPDPMEKEGAARCGHRAYKNRNSCRPGSLTRRIGLIDSLSLLRFRYAGSGFLSLGFVWALAALIGLAMAPARAAEVSCLGCHGEQ